MAKRTNNSSPEVHRDVLIISHEEFNRELDKRLEIGQELLDRKIQSPPELTKSEKDFTLWDEFNLEYLKQSFDRPNNDYHKEYNYTSLFFGIMRHQLSFLELVQRHKVEIDRQLSTLRLIRGKSDLIGTRIVHPDIIVEKKDASQFALEILGRLFAKFHRIAQALRNRHGNRPTLIINDEFDVQDLLRAILKEHFDDVRDEDYVPSYAGSNSRIDFVLRNEKVIIETKMTNEKLRDREVGDQLLIDIGRYKKYPDCSILIVFIYDKGDYIINKPGLIKDLNSMSTSGLLVQTFINPE